MTTIRTMVLLCALFLVGGTCGDDYEPTTRIDIHAIQAIKDWKAAGNPWSQRCSPYQVYLHPTPQDDLPNVCGGDSELWACLDGFDIFMAEEIWDTVRSNYVVEHELRHWLAGCEFGTVNGAHDDPRVWYLYKGRDIRN